MIHLLALLMHLLLTQAQTTVDSTSAVMGSATAAPPISPQISQVPTVLPHPNLDSTVTVSGFSISLTAAGTTGPSTGAAARPTQAAMAAGAALLPLMAIL